MSSICSIGAGVGFFTLGVFSSLLNSPKQIIYGSYLCSLTGVLCHTYGFRKLDIIVTLSVILVNGFIAYINNYLDMFSIFFAFLGTYNYLNKTSHHVMLVQFPFFISIINMILLEKKNTLRNQSDIIKNDFEKDL